MEHATAAATAPPLSTVELPPNTSAASAPNSVSYSATTTQAAAPVSLAAIGETRAASAPVPEATDIVVPRFTPRIREALQLLATAPARHAREVTASDSDRRVFQNYANLALSKRTCFVIADRGVVYANA